MRGRKFYRHHNEANPTEYRRSTDRSHAGKDDQNRTILNALKPGNQFRFVLQFENLAPAELGALLWSLELEHAQFHRLGYAKPLGFGSISLAVPRLEILDTSSRYNTLEPNGYLADWSDQRYTLIEDFKRQLVQVYGQSFDALPNIRDLLALLGRSLICLFTILVQLKGPRRRARTSSGSWVTNALDTTLVPGSR